MFLSTQKKKNQPLNYKFSVNIWGANQWKRCEKSLASGLLIGQICSLLIGQIWCYSTMLLWWPLLRREVRQGELCWITGTRPFTASWHQYKPIHLVQKKEKLDEEKHSQNKCKVFFMMWGGGRANTDSLASLRVCFRKVLKWNIYVTCKC